MVASRLAWLTALGGVAVVVGLALASFAVGGSLGGLIGHDGPVSAGTSPSWGSGTNYSVTFTESGLPNGTAWFVDLFPSYGGWSGAGAPTSTAPSQFGPGAQSTTNTSVTFSVGNGSYQFGVGTARNSSTLYSPTPQSGVLTVNGSAVSQSIAFAPVTLYPVTFSESGLPNGTTWSVALWGNDWTHLYGPKGRGIGFWHHSGSQQNSSNGTTIGFALTNGSYPFDLYPVWTSQGVYLPTPSVGSFTVNGSAVSVAVTYAVPAVYNVTFSETGLPNATYWSASVFGFGWGGFGFDYSNASTISFSEVNGVYWYHIAPVWTSTGVYQPAPSAGNVTVNGSSVQVSVTFTLVAFTNVTFVETGLPTGTNWSVGLVGLGWGNYTQGMSSNSSITLNRPPGTYWYYVGPVWNATGVFTASPDFGNVTLSGTTLVVNVTFSFSNASGWWGPASHPARAAGPDSIGEVGAGRAH